MSNEDQSKKPIGADLIIPIAGGAYAIYYVYSVREFPFQAQLSGMFLAGLLGFLVLIYLARVALGLSRGRYSLGMGAFFGPQDSVAKRGAFVLLIVGYIAIVRYLGFTLTTFSFLAASFLILGVRPVWRALAVAAVAAIGGWLFFIVLLGTRFPAGPFERAMQAVF